jgi:hypothetical protein
MRLYGYLALDCGKSELVILGVLTCMVAETAASNAKWRNIAERSTGMYPSDAVLISAMMLHASKFMMNLGYLY